ncbi:hypothetical protein Tco_0155972 [Tanacetum coccineum]
MTIFYHSLKGSWSSISGRASIEGYYEENIDQRDQTDKDAVREDHVLNKKVIEATKAYTKNSTHLTELLTLIKNFDFQRLKSSVKYLQATTLSQDKHLAEWAKPSKASLLPPQAVCHKQHLLSLEGQQMLGENFTPVVTKEPLYHTKEETDDMETKETKDKVEKEQEPKRPTRAIPILIVKPLTMPNPDPVIDITPPEPQVTQREGKGIATEEQLEPSSKKLVPASKEVCPDPDAPILEEAEKIGLDPKKFISAKAGEKFKKSQDTEHQVLKIEHSKKVKRLMELNKKRFEQYMWTISNRLKLGPITDVKIHPNSKPAVLTVYMNNDKRNFEIYERLKKIPEELGIQSALPALILKQDPS